MKTLRWKVRTNVEQRIKVSKVNIKSFNTGNERKEEHAYSEVSLR